MECPFVAISGHWRHFNPQPQFGTSRHRWREPSTASRTDGADRENQLHQRRVDVDAGLPKDPLGRMVWLRVWAASHNFLFATLTQVESIQGPPDVPVARVRINGTVRAQVIIEDRQGGGGYEGQGLCFFISRYLHRQYV